MVKIVPLDNIIRALPYPLIRLDEPDRVVRGAFLDIKGSEIDVLAQNGVRGCTICQTTNFPTSHTQK